MLPCISVRTSSPVWLTPLFTRREPWKFRSLVSTLWEYAVFNVTQNDAIAIVTEWDEFKQLDYAKIFAGMQQPAFIFDGRNILDLAKLRALGFRAHGIGK